FLSAIRLQNIPRRLYEKRNFINNSDFMPLKLKDLSFLSASSELGCFFCIYPGLRFASTWAVSYRPFGPQNSPSGLKGQHIIARLECERSEHEGLGKADVMADP
ncbi:MAG: hypothetical protein Q8K75_02630, partial [Chlamydiales bacterium]|nr:hypothetical protein [Chlamydiales bacterium]